MWDSLSHCRGLCHDPDETSNFGNHLHKFVYFSPTELRYYSRFVGAVLAAAGKFNPRKYRKEYIRIYFKLYEEYSKSGDSDNADNLPQSFDAARRARWCEPLENSNLKNLSRKAWIFMRKHGGATDKTGQKPGISVNLILPL